MTNKRYWLERTKQNYEHIKEIEDGFLELQQKEYKRLLDKIDNDIKDIYVEMLEKDGEISNTALYNFNRYDKLRLGIYRKCYNSGSKTNAQMRKILRNVYKDTFGNALDVNDFTYFDNNLMESSLNSVRYGKNFSDRIWENTDVLAQSIDREVKNIISSGGTVQECKKAIKEQFNNSFYNTNRLVRTEIMYTFNQATADRYKKAGITKYQFCAALDKRTSKTCRRLDGKIFEFSKAKTGTNFPPMHPHCRSTILPIFDDKTENKSKNNSNTLTRQLKQAKIDLKNNDIQAINTYVTSESYIINDILRNGGQLSPKQSAFCKQLDKTLDKMPEFDGTVYRSITSNYIDDIEAFNSKYAVDKCITEPFFVSTSLEVYDDSMDIQFIIQSKHGKDISSINNNEKEILFKRNSKFIVTDRQGNTIYMEEI